MHIIQQPFHFLAADIAGNCDGPIWIGHELHPKLVAQAIEQLRTFLPKKVWREVMAEAPLLPRVASSDELGD